MSVETQQSPPSRSSWRPSSSTSGARAATPSRRGAPEPPRQRRPALAALAVLMVVGGALLAGLVAIRMDTRVPVVAAATDIAPGQVITAADLREVAVAADGLALIPTELVDQVLDGATYAKIPISADSLIDQSMLTREPPVGEGRAIVAVPLDPVLTPGEELSDGDLVQVVRVSGGEQGGRARLITEALVLTTARAVSDDLGAQQNGSVRLLVPTDAAADVVDASAANLAGLVLLDRGQPLDAPLEVGE